MPMRELLDQYAAGPALLRAAVSGIGREKLRLRPVAGRWSTLEVVCHLSDAEAVYAERIKRVLAEDEPPLRGFDPDVWMPRLAYHERDADEELELIELVRSQIGEAPGTCRTTCGSSRRRRPRWPKVK